MCEPHVPVGPRALPLPRRSRRRCRESGSTFSPRDHGFLAVNFHAYLIELFLRFLLLRGVDRRPQQLRELSRIHRSGPPQLTVLIRRLNFCD